MKRQTLKKLSIFLLAGLMTCVLACDGPTENPSVPAKIATEEEHQTETDESSGKGTEASQSESSSETAESSDDESSSETLSSESESTAEDSTEAASEYDEGRVDCSTLDTESSGFAVVDENGKCYMGKADLESFHPASITKVLTALVAIEHLGLDDEIVVSENAVKSIAILSSGVSPSLKPGEKFTVRDMLYALILPSTNAAANVLAEAAAQSVEGFVVLMNQKAEELGCKNSTFKNPHGLDEDEHLSCPYDMALILRAALENPELKKILSAKTYEMAATEYTGARTLSMGHSMLNGSYACAGVFAGKTGSTVLGGDTLVTAVERDGKTFFICTMHSMESHQYMDTDNIIRYAYAKWTKTKTNLLAYAYDIHMTASEAVGMTFTYKVSNKPKKMMNAYWPLAIGTSAAKFSEILTIRSDANTLLLSGASYGAYAVQLLVTNASDEQTATMVNVLHCGGLIQEGIATWDGAQYLLSAGNIVNVGLAETTSSAYFADATGVLKKGLVLGKYFAGDDYKLVTGWRKIDNDSYYFQPDGRMAVGSYFVDGDVYRFSNEGKLIDTQSGGFGE